MKTAPQFKITVSCAKGKDCFEFFSRNSGDAMFMAHDLRRYGRFGEFYRLDVDEVSIDRFSVEEGKYFEVYRF